MAHACHAQDPAREDWLKNKNAGNKTEIEKEKAESDIAAEHYESEKQEAVDAETRAKKELAEYVYAAFGEKLDLRKSFENLQKEVKKLERKKK